MRHVEEARAALRAGDAPEAVRAFLRALDRLAPPSPARDVVLWGLISAFERTGDYDAAVRACRALEQGGHHPFYRAKGKHLEPVFAALYRRIPLGPEVQPFDPVERVALARLGRGRRADWLRAAWSAYLWSVDQAPRGVGTVAPWAQALLALTRVLEGEPPPPWPPLHFAHLWKKLAPAGDAAWLLRYAAGIAQPPAEPCGPSRRADRQVD